MNRQQLARHAFNKASDQLLAAVDAGTVSAADAAVKFSRLRDAYQTRKQDIELGAFFRRNGLEFLLAENAKRREKLDATLTDLARGSKDFRPVSLTVEGTANTELGEAA